jgi:hypothetical protein
LIGLYMVIGAFIFRYLEADSQMEVAVVAFQVSSHTEVVFIFRYLEATVRWRWPWWPSRLAIIQR